MPDEWDIFPAILPPCYPVRFSGAENKRLDELCERIRKDHERRCEDAQHEWPQRRVELVKEEIRLLRHCLRTPAVARPRRERGCVYLMWCPSLGAYKIGRSDDVHRRIGELRQEVDPQIERHTIYRTPVSLPLLEMALHRHFRHFHFESDESEELFKLPQEEVDGFEATTAVIEQHLLAVEILHLKGRLAKFQAELRAAD